MIPDLEREIILSCVKKYGVTSIYLFGSSIADRKEANDIDIGVQGIEPRLFLSFTLSCLGNY